MVDVSAERVIACRPDEFLSFVMDVRAYQRVDGKLARIDTVRREGRLVLFRFKPRLAGIPLAPLWQRVELTDNRIDIRHASRFLQAVVPFHGSFVCSPIAEGTHVVRSLRFDLPRPLSWLLGARLADFLREDIPRELKAAAADIEPRSSLRT